MALSQFGFDEGQSKSGIDVRFARTRDELILPMEASPIEPEPALVRKCLKRLDVRGGAGCEQQRDPVPACVGEPQLQAVTQLDDMRSGPIRCLSHERQIADHLAAATEIARDGDPLQLRAGHREVGYSRPEQRVGMVDEPLTLGAPGAPLS